MAKGDIIRALMGMKHSPAGTRYKDQEKVLASRRRLNKIKEQLKKKKKKDNREDVYFRGNKRESMESQLKKAGLSEEDLRSFRGKG